MTAFVCAAYISAMVLANLLVFTIGPWFSPVNAFVLIGLDLSVRDWLHVRLSMLEMGVLIGVGGVVTYALAPGAQHIALASAAAFSCAAVVDWLVFGALGGRSWLTRANGSNMAGAAVDSMVFPTMAFGGFLPGVVLLQFVAKVAGGALWAYVLSKLPSTIKTPCTHTRFPGVALRKSRDE